MLLSTPRVVSMNCEKRSYNNKKVAKKTAHALSHSDYGGRSRFSEYHCKDCNSWHVCTNNRRQLKYNSQHSRGGRKSRRNRK